MLTLPKKHFQTISFRSIAIFPADKTLSIPLFTYILSSRRIKEVVIETKAVEMDGVTYFEKIKIITKVMSLAKYWTL